MDIRVVSTNRIFYRVDATLAELLLELLPAAVERVTFNAPAVAAVPATVPQWNVRKNPITDVPEIICTICNSEQGYSGDPDKVTGYFGGKAQRTPPQEIIDRYRAQFNAFAVGEQANLRARSSRG